jgi:alpha-tubulin suppressor-like RCC1 family protein
VTSSSSNSGANLTLNFGLPAGQTGAAGATGTNGITPTFSASATTLSAGSDATVTATTSNGGSNVALAFGIPQGAAGTGGSNLTLSDATPSNLGTASAGSSNLAARADHVHTLPSLSTLGAAAANHAHNYVTALNNLTGGVTLAAGGNVTISSANSTLTISASGGLDQNGTVDGGEFEGFIPQNTITITQQPAAQTASNGAATFSVSATSTPGGTLSYQWQRQDGGFGEFFSIVGATSSTLSLSSLLNTLDDGDRYRVLVSSTNAVDVTSDSALLAVPANTITITTQPTNQSASSGAATFTAAATVSPSGTPSYQWQRSNDAGVTWANVVSATSATLSLTGLTVEADGGARFRVVVSATNAASVTSNAATLTVEANNTITITQQPTSQTAVNGDATFTVTASSAPSGTPAYQWQRSNDAGVAFANVSGATSATLVLSGMTVVADNNARYRVLVSAANAASVTSNSATLTVPQITITAQPSNQTAAGGAAAFSVTAATTGLASLSYQWQKLDFGGSWANVSGATSATISLTGLLQAADNGDQYRVVVSTADAASVTSSAALLSVQDIAITSQPSDQTASGGTATFSVTATGSGTLGYQWQQSSDGGESWSAVSGATTSTLSLSGIAGDSNERQYRAVVSSSGLTSVTSVAALLSVPSLLFTWGQNSQGQLGDGTLTGRSSPLQLGSSVWKVISAGYRFTHAIRSDNTLWAWGDNNNLMLGDGSSVDRLSPVQIGLSSWKSVAGAVNGGVAIRSDNTLWAWGRYPVGDGTTTNRSSPVQVGASTWSTAAAGWSHFVAIRSDGTLWTWGDNSSGQLPTADYYGGRSPFQVGAATWRQASAGSYFSSAVRNDGTLWSWGANNYGQLGDGTTTSRLMPVQIGSSAWKSVSAGDYFAVAIRSDGTLWSWGLNSSGQLGNGTTVDSVSPTQVGSSSWLAVAAGGSHTVAIRSDNTLWAWGLNSNGQLGDGTTTNRLSPVQIGSAAWQSISAGVAHTVAIAYAT